MKKTLLIESIDCASLQLSLTETLEANEEAEYGMFERFFHRDSFIAEVPEDSEEDQKDESAGVYKCRLDRDREQSEKILSDRVKTPLLAQVDEILQYICNGFIHDMPQKEAGYTEEERREIFQSAVKLLYRCLFFFYAEARRLLPSDPEKLETYESLSIETLCREAHKLQWKKRSDTDQYDLWKHLKGLVRAVNEGDPEYGIMGYDGGLFDDEEEKFLGKHQLRNDFLARALYLLAYVEPLDNDPDKEYTIPYEDLEVRHLGELYENILEYTVQLADADRIRRRTQKGVEILLASQTEKHKGDTLIHKGQVYFGESALERKQTGSYYTPESLVRFLNEKTIVNPLRETFETKHRQRFNDFLEQIRSGPDLYSKRGAAQSAAALVERFVDEDVLRFRVCDPAMGSGHFLVDATNQMAGLVVSLLEEIPAVDDLRVAVSSKPNDWRRRITRHCIYGVDINPLAVNLAKLSLWLNCFAVEHKLTFLDHHLRQGNSLIGIRSFDQLREIPLRKKDRRKKDEKQLVMNFGNLSATLAKAAENLAAITAIDEDDTDAQKSVFDEVQESASKRLKPLADLFTAYLMDGDIGPGAYRTLFTHLASGKTVEDLTHDELRETWESVEGYRDWHEFYHWPLEFPDVFGPGTAGGFSATVGNPPWDVLQPSTQEFYLFYDPDFRKYKKQEATEVIKLLKKAHPKIYEKWSTYENKFRQSSAYFKEPLAYSYLQRGKIDLYKAFLERSFALLNRKGNLGILIPSGIYTDQSCQQLRQNFFSKSLLSFLYCFENRWPTSFNAVDGRFKFVAFGCQKGGKTKKFKCAFMQHDPERLISIDASPIMISIEQIRKFSPNSLSLMEFTSPHSLEIASKIYADYPLLGETLPDAWNVKFLQELNMTSGVNLLSTEPTECPLYEGKMIWQFNSFYDAPQYWADLESALGKMKVPSPLLPRVVHRRIARSTDERTLISTVIPNKTLAEVNCTVIWVSDEHEHRASINSYLCGCLNSFVLDFILRHKITTTLNMFFLETLPVPRDPQVISNGFEAIVSRTLRLLCTTNFFSEYWKSVFSETWQLPSFWYPPSDSLDYGPAHEQEIRHRLAEEAKSLTHEWGPHCGVHDRLPDRRDTGDRAQLRAEIDAYVAHLYGLSRDDFAYILDTFPVLKRKEEAAFGEFMSKRKCLEEYDRIGRVLGRIG
ncbi:BREX-1 system adenine-specific DNA-methyltransferase PglX [Desulfoferrobacter suflitae]|uniref:BREX-1 system adenine-specific DNA-methyltransferase PglX n=1 Tax=Desulfoferrobacter suflitae TaxID=2865782 RepID=UPI0021642C08|nr:BREX-1 system adenine-specific DNA-methyltransferase PglX [Desulfoferrobacter suflitae]MCK8601975.1 BREX-1 system adenine-specific DNA-methyltransferase PglX [Desulfoferrobacter suflitae]